MAKVLPDPNHPVFSRLAPTGTIIPLEVIFTSGKVGDPKKMTSTSSGFEVLPMSVYTHSIKPETQHSEAVVNLVTNPLSLRPCGRIQNGLNYLQIIASSQFSIWQTPIVQYIMFLGKPWVNILVDHYPRPHYHKLGVTLQPIII